MSSEPELVGRYEVFAPFTRGGMATMHVARLRGPGGFSKLFAVKRQTPTPHASERDGRMFLEEARLAARIRSPFVVPVIELLAEGSQLSIVMELVEGVSLSTLLASGAERSEPMPIAIASTILSDVLRGLHAAHEATDADGRPLELVHRDVSPQNVVVGVDGVARVVDFGIARALGRAPLTATGEVKGKVAYIAPEQLRPGPITRQADVYAAGVVLWEALVGEKLRADDDVANIVASFDVASPTPSSRRPAIPPALDDVVEQALSKRPHDRFATAEAMAIALEEAVAPASRHEVTAYVEQVAFEGLARLAEAMREAELHVSAVSEDLHGVPTSLAAAPAPAERHWLALGTVALGVVILIVLFAKRSTNGAVGQATAAAVEAPSEAPSLSEPLDPPSGETPNTAALTSAEAPFETPPPARARASSPSVQRRTSKPRGACTPPFTIDEAGIKHYKPACIP